MKKEMKNMKDYLEDLFKIYNSAIDSYSSKVLQVINEKYTLIDKAMIATYLYIKILDELGIIENIAKDTLINYLLKQIIYGETGNLDLQITNKSKEAIYKEVIDQLIIEKFAYKNRILVHLKYEYKIMPQNQYHKLIDFCEEIAEFYIMEKLILRGNTEAEIYRKEKQKKFEKDKMELNKQDNKIAKEMWKILEKITTNKFEDTEYKQLIEVALNLRDVYRYSTLTTIVPENVLFHQYVMTIVSILFSQYLNKELGENFDIYKIMYKSLFHDFGEYKGNEIVTQVKNYNEETKKMFAEMEAADEKELENRIGHNLYEIVTNYKAEKEGYLSNLLDKIFGIMKLWVEEGYMNNLTYIKSICSIYQERFKKLKMVDKEIKNKDFLFDLLRESYIYIKEHMMKKDKELFLLYFTKEEGIEIEKELELIKRDRNAFLA